MKILMAVSSDGYVARGPDDDMSWTGEADKNLFRLLTLADNAPIVVGTNTAKMMPRVLPGRQIIHTSRQHMDLETVVQRFPEAWLCGGINLAVTAIRLKAVDRVVLSIVPKQLGKGVSWRPLRDVLPSKATHIVRVDGLVVRIYHLEKFYG